VDRAVDELYYFCEDEGDDSIANDAAAILTRSAADFEKLVSRVTEQRNFEEGKQTAISWEVRKTSSGVRRTQVFSNIFFILLISV
jgi:hypothetical protein